MSPKIFIIEDDHSIRRDLSELLTSEGYGVQSFANGKEGLEGLHSAAQLPQLILLDLMMPIMNGYDFLVAMKKNPKFKEINVLVLSADGQSDTRLDRDQIQGFMKKPIDLEPFLNLIEKIVLGVKTQT